MIMATEKKRQTTVWFQFTDFIQTALEERATQVAGAFSDQPHSDDTTPKILKCLRMSLSAKWYVKGRKITHLCFLIFFFFFYLFLLFFYIKQTEMNFTCHIVHLLGASHIFIYIFMFINTFLKNSNIQPHVLDSLLNHNKYI